MIVSLFLNIGVIFLSALFSWLPEVTTLPTIVDYDIDAYLNLGSGYLHTYFASFWPIAILFQGFLFLLGYFIIKITLAFFLGSRTPGH